MARQQKVSSSILNVRVHPHTDDSYVKFMTALYDLRQPVKIHGDRHAVISSIDRSGARSGYISGTITTFIKIELDGRWFDSVNLVEASDEQVSKINIPTNLAPNSASFFWYFDVASHKLYVQQYSFGKVLSSKQAHEIFSVLSRNQKIMSRFNEASITIVQDKLGLEKLFKLDRITKISITILKPNPDVFSEDFEAVIEKHLADTGSRRIEIIYTADTGATITPDDDIKKASSAALENGEVVVHGRDSSGAVKKSTADMPKILQTRYDPEVRGEREAFLSLVPKAKI